MNKAIILYCILPFVFCAAENSSDVSYDYPDKLPNSEETKTLSTNNTIRNKTCTKMLFYCESCSDLVMCIDTEYGFTKQHVACSPNTTCLRDECTPNKNPLCDGTADIPFECHVPGVFPDPFDCRKYHFCVPKSTKMANGSLQLNHFYHSCQENDDVEYSFDPRTRYCKFKLENGCTKWPIPLCEHEGQTDAFVENRSIFYVCDLVEGHLYPHLYACPHGEEYNKDSTKCELKKMYDYGVSPVEYNGFNPYNGRLDG